MMTMITKRLLTVLAAMMLLAACGTRNAEPTVEGHYTYEHAFNYDLYGNHLDVHETGTMDFAAGGSALDSARQVYVATLGEGGTATYVFNYVSPSRWSREGEELRFAGIKECFRMELVKTTTEGCEPERAARLAEKIIEVVSGSIDYEYLFRITQLSQQELRWSFTYKDGHEDTWLFTRQTEAL